MASRRRRGRSRRVGDTPPLDPGTGTESKDRMVDIGLQVDLSSETHSFMDSKCVRWFLAAAVLVIGVILAVFAMEASIAFFGDQGFSVGHGIIEDMGMEGIILFRQHDHNNDGYLSLEEFEPVAHRLIDVNETFAYDSTIEEWDEVLTVEASFEPLQLDTLTKDLKDQRPAPGTLDPLKGLREWKAPAVDWQNFGASHFKPFLPRDESMLDPPGQVYYIIPVPKEMARGPTLSSNRYFPPKLVRDTEIIIHRLLSMFHSHPFVYMRFAAQGSIACVRAVSEKYVDIIFRIHAEFQLNEAPYYPFWFTPGQFTGNVILSRDGKKVLGFHLYVPTTNRLNVDLEWLNAPLSGENMEVDIGFMPQMELRVTRGSTHPPTEPGQDRATVYVEQNKQPEPDIEWNQEISQEEARRRLEVQLYPFKQIPYYNLTEALHQAREQGKLVHSVQLWGVLDDQSC